MRVELFDESVHWKSGVNLDVLWTFYGAVIAVGAAVVSVDFRIDFGKDVFRASASDRQ